MADTTDITAGVPVPLSKSLHPLSLQQEGIRHMTHRPQSDSDAAVWRTAFDSSVLFSHWAEPDRQRLLDTAVERQLLPGQTLYTRGEAARALYFVESGCLKVMVPTVGGDEAVLDVVGAGQWLGELGVIDQLPRQHSTIAMEPCQCVGFDSAVIARVLQANPGLYQGVALLLCQRLRAMYAWGEDNLLGSVKSRIVHRLRHIASSLGAPLEDGYLLRTRISQELLAAMLGVTRQTLNKELAGLKQAGLVKKVGAYYWVKRNR